MIMSVRDGKAPASQPHGSLARASRAILGIDAAWTPTQPTGIALVAEANCGWHLISAEPSVADFLGDGWQAAGTLTRPRGSGMVATALLERADVMAGVWPSLITVDMPMARSQILGRRVSDNAVSREFGRMGCGTHTPSSTRPGAISDLLRDGFVAAGYPLATDKLALPALIEVYPHPALLPLMQADYRLPYKFSKIRRYWPECIPLERRQRLICKWESIVATLDEHITGTASVLALPQADSRTYVLKSFEDALDAVICAWVGICALEGHAEPFGDNESAIWIPRRPSPVAHSAIRRKAKSRDSESGSAPL